jgi:hypothetical protein
VTEKQQRVLPWWRLLANGSYAFFVRSGVKPIEFEKGKTAIAVPSLDKLPTVIDTLIAAVKSGELDSQLEQSRKKPTPKGSEQRDGRSWGKRLTSLPILRAISEFLFS